jgi:GTPase
MQADTLIAHELNAIMSRENPEPVERISPERHTGNIEYKWKLVGKSAERIEHLTTQMNYRLTEGSGEAYYMIGVHDNGVALGLPDAELIESVALVKAMAVSIGVSASILRVMQGRDGKVVQVVVRRDAGMGDCVDIKICLVGDSGGGKSTLLGVLTSAELDNGHGRARLSVFRHRHELQQGHTSSLSRQIIGFDRFGTLLTTAASAASGFGSDGYGSDSSA